MYVLSAISLMSAPAAKALSLPVSTMAAIAESPSSSSNAWPSSPISAAFSAFSACGRFSLTMPTGPCRSTRMLLYCSPLMDPSPQCPTDGRTPSGLRPAKLPDYGDGEDWDRKEVLYQPGTKQHCERAAIAGNVPASRFNRDVHAHRSH